LSIEDYEKLTVYTDTETTAILGMPKSNVLVYWLDNRERVIVRPSGTEPKIKFYFEAIQSVDSKGHIPATQKAIEQRLKELWVSTQSML
jgi:phosphomannomutase